MDQDQIDRLRHHIRTLENNVAKNRKPTLTIGNLKALIELQHETEKADDIPLELFEAMGIEFRQACFIGLCMLIGQTLDAAAHSTTEKQ